MNTDTILQESHDHVWLLTLNRPEKKNALDRAMYQRLTGLLQAAGGDDTVRVVVLHGAGEAFCSGNDIADFVHDPPTDTDHPVFAFLHTLATFDKPLVAAVDGVAVGIGTTLLLHCELVYATDRSRFQLPFVNLGLCPEAGASYLLPARVGYQRAAELLLLGEPFGAEQALAMGLINERVAAPELLARALARAGQLSTRPAAAVRLVKQLMREHRGVDLLAVIGREAEAFGRCLQSPEAHAALQGFLAGRDRAGDN